MKRPDYVGFDFDHIIRQKGTPNKFGQFVVIELGIFPNHNKYVCHLKDDPRPKEDRKEYHFDVGYVQRLLMDTITPLDC